MKLKLTTLIFGLFLFGTLYAQSTQDAVKMYHYERYETAVQLLQQTLKSNPNDLNAWYLLTKSYQANKDFDKAEKAFASIPASLQSQPLYKVIKGRIDLQKGDANSAISDFNEALGTKRKKDPSIQLAIAETNIDLEKGNLNYAIDLLSEAEKKDAKNPAIYLARGDAYRKLYDGSQAFLNYQLAADRDKSDPVAYYKMGKIYQTQNNADAFTEYYDKAIQADPSFGKVYYQLYYYYYFKDVAKAYDNLKKYISNTDTNPKNDYFIADIQFVAKKYSESIDQAKKILARDGVAANPRLYKLIAYSYDEQKKSEAAREYMKKYFSIASDTSYAPEDFELMAKLSELNKQNKEAGSWLEKAFVLQKDTAKKASIVRKLIEYNKTNKAFDKQTYWFTQLNRLKVPMNNVDLFKWGVATYNSKDYVKADSIFGMYASKYPDQTFGYYWRARSNAAIDTAMESGIAIPYYEKLIQVAEKKVEDANNKKWLIQAYGYIAAFKVNQEKLYDDALAYYDKILELDPANADAGKYKAILEKMVVARNDDKSESKEADKPGNN